VLFSPLGKPADRAIYFACVNFFFFFFFYFIFIFIHQTGSMLINYKQLAYRRINIKQRRILN